MWSFSGEMARGLLQSQLTRLNGATVDVGAVEIRWRDGRAEIRDLQVCDTSNLDRNLLQAAVITADLDLADVLRRRISIDLVRVVDALNDETRATPGVIFLDPGDDAEAETTPDEEIEDENVRSPEADSRDYLKNAREWRTRLETDQSRHRRARKTEYPTRPMMDDPSEGKNGGPESPSFEAWLREQVDLHGYAGVRATHLIDETPTLLVRRIEASGGSTGTRP